MDISFVLLTWNSEKYISKCLESLFADMNKTQFSYEIFIVDNGSKDNTIQTIKSFKDKFTSHIIPIYLEKNRGTTYSRNLALKRAKGEYIVIMDSDVEVCKGTIEKLIQIFKHRPNVGMAAPRLIYDDGRLQKSTDDFPTILSKFRRFFFLKLIERKEKKADIGTDIREVDYAISAMWILKRELLHSVGLLDEKIFYAPEDVDYCLRVWQASYKVVYMPHITCVHHAQEISRGFKINRATFEHIRGLIYYFQKHKYVFRRPKIAYRD